MARLLLLSIVLLIGPICLSLPTLAAAQSSDTPSRYRVAVLDFSVTDLTGTVSDPESVGRAMAIAFQTPLVQSRRFTVLTRNQLDEVLGELVLAEQGILDPDAAQQMGQLAGVEVIISGTIVVNAPGALSVTANFIDVGSGEVAAALTMPAAGPQDFGRLAAALVGEAASEFPPQGRIVEIADGRVFIDLGSETGLSSVGATGVIYRNSEVAGLVFSEQIGSFEVVQIGPQVSLVEVTESDDRPAPRIGDVVTIQPLSGPRLPPVTDVGTADEATGTETQLAVRGVPEGAQIYLDDVFVGRLRRGEYLDGVARGSYQLRIEAAGYQTQTQAVRATGDGVTTVEVGLEPLPQAATPSFDCTLASSWSETRLCRYPDLAALDTALTDTYEALRGRIGEGRRTELRDEQRAWLRERERCVGEEVAGYRCLYRLISERVDVLSVRLEQMGGAVAPFNIAAVPDGLEPQGVILLPLFSGRWDFTSARLVDADDLAALSCPDLALMRNEILARHGFIFARADLAEYFNAQAWYPPAGMVKDPNVANQWAVASLSTTEERNIRTIRDAEMRRCFATF
ncbi:MAG: YARHG domain-containing protein [Trueperaceae bacterium]|nr:YARHG domain-containing protein [Trueperaceae bacterium]